MSMLEKVQTEVLTLRKVRPSDLDAIAEYRAEFLEKGGSMDGCSNLRRYENMMEWYDWIQKAESRWYSISKMFLTGWTAWTFWSWRLRS